MATIDERLDEIAIRLDTVATGSDNPLGHLLIALSNLLEVGRQQQKQIEAQQSMIDHLNAMVEYFR